ncbi:MAG: helix-turn-helix domain-containing protein [Actinomycetota bacterium]|nr:helix-turn-helix domain-containing protein [Actinomycetota bacterium]
MTAAADVRSEALDPARPQDLSELADATALRTGSWVVVERLGVVVAHGAGAGPCPAGLTTSLVTKRTASLRETVRWIRHQPAPTAGLQGVLDGVAVAAVELGGGVTAWFIGGLTAPESLEELAAAVRGETAPVTDAAVEELLHPRGLARRGRAPCVRLVAVRAPGQIGVLGRRLRALVGVAVPMHTEEGVVFVGLPPDSDVATLLARLRTVLPGATGGVADVPEDATDWVVPARLAVAAAATALELGIALGELSDPAVATELVVREAQAAAGELARSLPEGPVQRLHAHDARMSGDLVASLTAWCRAGGDIAAAAASLYVHSNTLRYRLRRAGAVSGLDLADPRQLLALQLLLPG